MSKNKMKEAMDSMNAGGSGAFQLHDSLGFDLTLNLMAHLKHGRRFDFTTFWGDAYKAGWSIEKISHVLDVALKDSFYPMTIREVQHEVFETGLIRLAAKAEQENAAAVTA